MRTPHLAAICLLLGLALSGLAPAVGAQTETVTVHLTVETHVGDRAGLSPAETSDLPGTASCQVIVPAGSDGTEVLDAATTSGCITGWEGQQTSFGTYIVAIDDMRADGFTCLLFAAGVCDWWEHSVNGQTVGYGAGDYTAEDGDTVRWQYRNTL